MDAGPADLRTVTLAHGVDLAGRGGDEVDVHAGVERRLMGGTGDGEMVAFQLTKTYGASFDPYKRPITKPVVETAVVRIDGVATIAAIVDDLRMPCGPTATGTMSAFTPGAITRPARAVQM